MSQAGRNDPCPCGSGKKYKSCCLRKDRVSASRDVNMRTEDILLLREMFAWVSTPRFAQDLADGMAIFWGGRFTPEAFQAIDRDGMRRFAEWFLHDYRYGDGEHIIDLFIEREGHRYQADAQTLMKAWAESTIGVFRYLQRLGEDLLLVYDPLPDSEREVKSRLLAHNAQPGDMLVGRLYALDDTTRLSSMTLILPEEYEQPLVEYVRNAYAIYCDEHPKAEWSDFLRENGQIFNAFLLSSRAESLRSLIGPGTRFYDPATSRDQMREITREQRAREAASEVAPPETLETGRNVRRTSGGIILPGAEEPQPTEQEASPKRSTILIPGRDA